MTGESDAACNPADQKPDATPVTVTALNGNGDPPTGPYDVVVESDPGIPDHTIWRPEPLGEIKHPIMVWGMGGCSKDSTGNGLFTEFLREVVSHGILVISDGTPGGTGPSSGGAMGDGAPLINGIDWALAENERPCSKYYHKLEANKIAVSGQSCGGLMAISASADPRVTVSMPMDSGLFSRDPALYAKLHAPMAIIDAGPNDIAYANGQADFDAIDNIPLLFANWPYSSNIAHDEGFMQDNGGEFGTLAVAWLNWWLFDDSGPTGKGMFIGDQCGLCGTQWDLQWKMKPQ